MSNVSFKKFVSFVNREGDVSDEQINEIFGLFKNNDKVEKLKKERERLKGMSDKKKAELDQALKDFKDGKKPNTELPKGAQDKATWDDALDSRDRTMLAKMDKEADRKEAEKKAGPKNMTGRNFYEADATVKAIKLKIDPDMSDADIWNFIENQDEVTIEDFEKKGDTLYLYPYIDIEIGHPKLKGMQQRLQRMI